MNELERMNKAQEAIAKAINESNLPLSTVYMILVDFQRQVGEVIAKGQQTQNEQTEEQPEEMKGSDE